MSDKRPVDLKRDRGGSVDIGTEDDGAILEMYNLGGRMLVIKEKAIYELRFADDIDPNRENPNLPPSTQKLILPLSLTPKNKNSPTTLCSTPMSFYFFENVESRFYSQ